MNVIPKEVTDTAALMSNEPCPPSQTATIKRGMLATMITSVREEGFMSLFHGLTATWLRQASYSITRFAAYEKAKDFFTEGGQRKPTTPELFLCSGGAGFVAG